MKKHTILVVDDVDFNRIILNDMLNEEYTIVEAEDGIQAIDYLFNTPEPPALVLLDIMMPEMDGHEVLELMKGNPMTAKIPVVFITAANSTAHEARGLKEGAQDYIAKPFNQEAVLARVHNLIELNLYREHLEEEIERRVNQLMHTRDKMLETMANMIEHRNLESGQHVKRTSDLTAFMIKSLMARGLFTDQLNAGTARLIAKAVPTHDIGKIGIPDEILLKPGRLTPEEFEVIKGHAAIGGDIIKSMLTNDEDADEEDKRFFQYCFDICRHHHERWDGKGYPDGLAGEDIPLPPRILSIIDVYDALVSPRVYKPPISHEQAVEIILAGDGTQFDPTLIEVFREVHPGFEKVHKEQTEE